MAFWKAEKGGTRQGEQLYLIYEKENATNLNGDPVEIQGNVHEVTIAQVDERIAHATQTRNTAEAERQRLEQIKAYLLNLP